MFLWNPLVFRAHDKAYRAFVFTFRVAEIAFLRGSGNAYAAVLEIFQCLAYLAFTADRQRMQGAGRSLYGIGKEAESILSAARKKALDNEAAIVSKAREEAHSIVERASIDAEQEKLRVKDDVKKEIIGVATAMAKKAVEGNMDVSVQDSLVDETLKEIGDGTWLS